MIAFGKRLAELLSALDPPRSQAWLSEESGVSTSVISRLISGDRNPTAEVIENLAPVVGLEPSQLVFGTDAEARYRASGELVKKELYESVVRQSAEDQVRIADLERQLQSLPAALADLSRAHHALDRAERDLEDLRGENRALRVDVQRYRSGLSSAVAGYAALQGQLKTLADELSTTKKSSRASAILGAVGAFTGVITVAHFLANEDSSNDSPEPKKRTRKAQPR